MTVLSYDSLNDVPEDLRPHAKTEGEKVTVKVAPLAKVEEFRNTNIALRTETEKATKKVLDLAEILGLPAEFDDKILDETKTKQKSLVELRKKVDDKELVGAHGLEEAVTKRTTEMREAHEKQLREKAAESRAWQEQADKANKGLNEYVIRDHINRAILDPKSGVRHEALDDILPHAIRTFKVDVAKGKITPYEGDAIMYGESGSDPMTPSEWLKKLTSTRPHYLLPSQGGGAGSGSGVGSGGSTTYTAEQIKAMPQDQYNKLRKEGKI